ncbi:MAG TPA: NAD-dependent epimerase/dehydratase family protein [Actinospica sp.]|nr:NAD-dependent epimerase/dehydratase family protein [Actinospica sp.]
MEEHPAVSHARPPFRRAVVTGGAGFLGAHLCRALLAEHPDTEVVCVDAFLTSSADSVADLLPDPRFALLRRDVSEGIDVEGPVDLVMHLASPASPLDYARHPIATLEAGSLGTRHALELARVDGARFVMASTSEVYGEPLTHPQSEGYWGNVNPIGPRSVYDEAKRFSEALTAAYRRHRGTDTAIARIFNTYGPGMRAGDGRVVPTFITQALAGAPMTVTGDGRQTRSLCHVSDTVRGLIALARSGLPGPVNLGNPEEMSMLDLARRIAALCFAETGIEQPPPRLIARPVDDPTTRCPDIALARQALGWEPEIGWREGLLETLRWFAGSGSGARSAAPLSEGQIPAHA